MTKSMSKKKGKTTAVNKLSKKLTNLERKIDGEIKNMDKTDSVQPTNSGLYSLLLNNVPQGTGENQRIGERIRLKNLSLKYTLVQSSLVTDTFARVVLILDKKPLNIAPAADYAGVFETLSVNAPRKKDEEDRFTILASRIHTMSSNGSSCVNGSIYKLFKSMRNEYTTAGALNTNAIYLMVISDKSGANAPQFQVYSRLNYYDN